MRIDAHQHFWQYDAAQYPWIDESMGTLKRDFLPQNLSPLLKANNLSGSVVVQAREAEQETQWLLALAKDNPEISAVVGWIDLCSSDLTTKLEQFKAEPKLKGFRHVLQGERNPDFMLSDSFVDGVKLLAKYNYSYDLLVTADQLPQVCLLLDKLPKMRLVLDHIGKPDIKHASWQQWSDCIETLAEHQHLYCKVSGMVTEADWRHWSASDIEPYLQHIFNCFGTERLMFGSDWPVCLVAASYEESVELVEHFSRRSKVASTDAVMGGNAAFFYQIDTDSVERKA